MLLRFVQSEQLKSLTDGQLLERYLSHNDHAAFEMLVQRLGPMVLGVCRRVLRDGHDIDDAFQASFLVLVRKAESIVPHEKIGPWLYGVAYRTALAARNALIRRRQRERHTDTMDPVDRSRTQPHEWQEVLDQELHRLPAKYREPILLCDLQGHTHKEAARRLGWPEGTLSGRLSRAAWQSINPEFFPFEFPIISSQTGQTNHEKTQSNPCCRFSREHGFIWGKDRLCFAS